MKAQNIMIYNDVRTISNDLSLVHAVPAEPTQRVGTVNGLMDEVPLSFEVSRLLFILLLT